MKSSVVIDEKEFEPNYNHMKDIVDTAYRLKYEQSEQRETDAPANDDQSCEIETWITLFACGFLAATAWFAWMGPGVLIIR